MAGLGWIGAADLIAIMDTCGVTSAIPRWGNEGIAETFLGIDSGASFSWQHDAVSAAGGNYRLCWYGASLLANQSVTLQDTRRSIASFCQTCLHVTHSEKLLIMR